MKNHRIAHLIYSEGIGGSEMLAANICNSLDRNLYDPIVLFTLKSTGAMAGILDHFSIRYHRLNLPWRRLPMEALYIAYWLRRLKIDILHVHHVPLYLRVSNAAKIANTKGLICTEHAKYSIERSNRLQNACRHAAAKAGFFTAVSHELKNYFIDKLGIKEELVNVIENGIDTARFSPERPKAPLRDQFCIGDQAKLLIHVGRMAEAKDHVTLIAAIKTLISKGHDIFLFLVGDGDLKSNIEKAIDESNLEQRIFLLGARTDIDTLLLGADIFVLSSKREGLPIALMEAMSCGLPVIATNVGGIPKIINDYENGLLVAPEMPRLLADKIENLIFDPDLCKRLGHHARMTIVHRYALSTTVQQYANLYEKLLA